MENTYWIKRICEELVKRDIPLNRTGSRSLDAQSNLDMNGEDPKKVAMISQENLTGTSSNSEKNLRLGRNRLSSIIIGDEGESPAPYNRATQTIKIGDDEEEGELLMEFGINIIRYLNFVNQKQELGAYNTFRAQYSSFRPSVRTEFSSLFADGLFLAVPLISTDGESPLEKISRFKESNLTNAVILIDQARIQQKLSPQRYVKFIANATKDLYNKICN
ncbi:MAG: hypothetical protein KC506_00310 [Nanoarchaeota archaeon]|nr:hypothetical protein [Nanoarchaeota archaeon]